MDIQRNLLIAALVLGLVNALVRPVLTILTLPITIRGSVAKYSLQIDSASVARRAVTNEVKAQAGAAAKKGIGRLFGR